MRTGSAHGPDDPPGFPTSAPYHTKDVLSPTAAPWATPIPRAAPASAPAPAPSASATPATSTPEAPGPSPGLSLGLGSSLGAGGLGGGLGLGGSRGAASGGYLAGGFGPAMGGAGGGMPAPGSVPPPPSGPRRAPEAVIDAGQPRMPRPLQVALPSGAGAGAQGAGAGETGAGGAGTGAEGGQEGADGACGGAATAAAAGPVVFRPATKRIATAEDLKRFLEVGGGVTAKRQRGIRNSRPAKSEEVGGGRAGTGEEGRAVWQERAGWWVRASWWVRAGGRALGAGQHPRARPTTGQRPTRGALCGCPQGAVEGRTRHCHVWLCGLLGVWLGPGGSVHFGAGAAVAYGQERAGLALWRKGHMVLFTGHTVQPQTEAAHHQRPVSPAFPPPTPPPLCPQGNTVKELMAFILAINEAVRGKKANDTSYSPSPAVQVCVGGVGGVSPSVAAREGRGGAGSDAVVLPCMRRGAGQGRWPGGLEWGGGAAGYRR